MNSLKQGLTLNPEHWAQMEADVVLNAPKEACGIIAGTGNQSQLVIPVTNILHSPSRFRMEPQEELNAFYMAEEKGLDLLAVYHSHPHGAGEPSVTDYDELTFPGIIYLIWYKGFGEWRCRGFLMNTRIDSIEVPVIITSTKKLSI
jgi:proteasome lid subunit RPN8/RPN11